MIPRPNFSLQRTAGGAFRSRVFIYLLPSLALGARFPRQSLSFAFGLTQSRIVSGASSLALLLRFRHRSCLLRPVYEVIATFECGGTGPRLRFGAGVPPARSSRWRSCR